MAPAVLQAWNPSGRLVPWVVYDLGRVAWVIDRRSSDLTDEERRIVREAATRMLRAIAST